jgi:hypothetical protein
MPTSKGATSFLKAFAHPYRNALGRRLFGNFFRLLICMFFDIAAMRSNDK